jgi:hypothetical protein
MVQNRYARHHTNPVWAQNHLGKLTNQPKTTSNPPQIGVLQKTTPFPNQPWPVKFWVVLGVWPLVGPDPKLAFHLAFLARPVCPATRPRLAPPHPPPPRPLKAAPVTLAPLRRATHVLHSAQRLASVQGHLGLRLSAITRRGKGSGASKRALSGDMRRRRR